MDQSLRNAIRDNGSAVREWRATRSQKAAKIKDDAQDTQAFQSSVAAAVLKMEDGGGGGGGGDSKSSNVSSKKKLKDMPRARGKHNSSQ